MRGWPWAVGGKWPRVAWAGGCNAPAREARREPADGAPRRPAEGEGGTPGNAGLSLLEVLLASVVLGVAILGIAGAFPAALRTVTGGGHLTRATHLAQQMMEAIRSDASDLIPRYAGGDGRGVSTEAPANFPQDWPWPCTDGSTWAGQFCGNTKLLRWRQDLGQRGDGGRGLAGAVGLVRVTDHERPLPGGGGAVSSATTLLRIVVTVNWEDALGRRQVTLTSTVPCARPGCD